MADTPSPSLLPTLNVKQRLLKQIPPHVDMMRVDPTEWFPLDHLRFYADELTPTRWAAPPFNRYPDLRDQGKDNRPSVNPSLSSFMRRLLDAGLKLVAEELGAPIGAVHRHASEANNMLNYRYWKDKKFFYPNDYRVQTRSRRILGEKWYARLSDHADATIGHGATYQQYKDHLLRNHAETEYEWAPTVSGTHPVLTYDVQHPQAQVVGYRNLSLEVREMRHHITQRGVSDRVFPVLVLGAECSDSSFIVISLPLHPESVKALPHSEYTRDRHLEAGRYVSVNYVWTADQRVHWVMATSSHAKGLIPQKLQHGAIPKAIAQDVPNFLEYVRARPQNPSPSPPP